MWRILPLILFPDAPQMVTNLEKMMTERLVLYRKKNKDALPTRILVYRGQSSSVAAQLLSDQTPQMASPRLLLLSRTQP
jgi:hypothetical protein